MKKVILSQKVFAVLGSALVIFFTCNFFNNHQVIADNSEVLLEEIQVLPSKISEEKKMLNNPANGNISDHKLINSQTKFGFKLFQEISRQNESDNIFISPLSVSLALSMIFNGADGQTSIEFADVMEVTGLSLSELNQANQNLLVQLDSVDEDIELTIANSIWTKLGFVIKNNFLQVAKQYNADVVELDFSRPSSTDLINEWIRDKTQGKITKLVEGLSPEYAMFLLNAIYFKGEWQSKFDPKQTEEQPFYSNDGTTIQHPLMSSFGQYLYYQNEDFQGVSLPYGEGRLSMYVFLPDKSSDLNSFVNKLTAENFNKWIDKFKLKEGSVTFPRFKQEYEISLNQVLQQLGLLSAFDRATANFSRLGEVPVFIDQVKHKAVVEVNEEGTEAAAATSIGVMITSVNIPFTMKVDRPFFYVIRDNKTGSVLFMGSILKPND